MVSKILLDVNIAYLLILVIFENIFLPYLMKYILFAALLFIPLKITAQDKKFKVYTIAFYNVENLFDTIHDAGYSDSDFTPEGKMLWTAEKYKAKLNNIAQVISEVGKDENPNPPVVIGLCEIENRNVLTDLANHKLLSDSGYGIVHFDSPDRRGIDVALLYQKQFFKPTSYKSVPLNREYNHSVGDSIKGKIFFTRNPLLVTGMLEGEEIHFIINHWPSRISSTVEKGNYRETAAALNRKTVDSLYTIKPSAKIIVMGDFNDGPYNNSIKKILAARDNRKEIKPGELFNPMAAMFNQGIGSTAYRDNWQIFDQIIISEPLLQKDYSSLRFWKASVFDKPYLKQQTGQYKGYPLRNHNGEVGYSDHFPVYIYLIKEAKR